MRKNARRRAEEPNIWEDKRVVIIGAIIVGVVALLATFLLFSNFTGNSDLDNTNPGQVISLEPGDEMDNTENASSSIGNTVKQQEETSTTNSVADEKNNTNNTTNTAKDNIKPISNTNKKKVNDNSNKKEEVEPTSGVGKTEDTVSFDWPVKGEILKAFSMDNLLFSSTLQEWTTHNGVDIKADKAQVVKAAADGTVKSIKNDPRFGLSVTIEHANGFRTVYSNLLTAEFVVEGEKVKQGQSIGTVGNTANFETNDAFHLHFEVLQNSEFVDPMVYLK